MSQPVRLPASSDRGVGATQPASPTSANGSRRPQPKRRRPSLRVREVLSCRPGSRAIRQSGVSRTPAGHRYGRALWDDTLPGEGNGCPAHRRNPNPPQIPVSVFVPQTDAARAEPCIDAAPNGPRTSRRTAHMPAPSAGPLAMCYRSPDWCASREAESGEMHVVAVGKFHGRRLRSGCGSGGPAVRQIPNGQTNALCGNLEIAEPGRRSGDRPIWTRPIETARRGKAHRRTAPRTKHGVHQTVDRKTPRKAQRTNGQRIVAHKTCASDFSSSRPTEFSKSRPTIIGALK